MTVEAGIGQPAGVLAEKSRFASLIEPYRPVLKAYCRSLSRSVWEADDLVQDTWMKAYRMFLRDPARAEMSKTYLFRIAQHTWIDRCRQKRRRPLSLLDDVPELSAASTDPLELREAMETLVAYLPARQRVLLLIDALGFTALETARLIGTTEGAVKAGLHRARAKLKAVRQEAKESRIGSRVTPAGYLQVNEQVVYAYLKAFQQHNPAALIRLLNEGIQQDQLPAVEGIHKGSIQGAQTIRPVSRPSSFLRMAA